jgi:hypothetical protein
MEEQGNIDPPMYYIYSYPYKSCNLIKSKGLKLVSLIVISQFIPNLSPLMFISVQILISTGNFSAL